MSVALMGGSRRAFSIFTMLVLRLEPIGGQHVPQFGPFSWDFDFVMKLSVQRLCFMDDLGGWDTSPTHSVKLSFQHIRPYMFQSDYHRAVKGSTCDVWREGVKEGEGFSSAAIGTKGSCSRLSVSDTVCGCQRAGCILPPPLRQ